jgi:hypothetical protein
MNIPDKVIALATHYLPNLEGRVQMYYRINKGKYNTGEEYKNGLSYYSPDFETWRGSNEKNPMEFVKNRLVCIKPGMAYNNDTRIIEPID